MSKTHPHFLSDGDNLLHLFAKPDNRIHPKDDDQVLEEKQHVRQHGQEHWKQKIIYTVTDTISDGNVFRTNMQGHCIEL